MQRNAIFMMKYLKQKRTILYGMAISQQEIYVEKLTLKCCTNLHQNLNAEKNGQNKNKKKNQNPVYS